MTDEKDDQLDRLIDQAAREMTMGEPSARFEATVAAHIERARAVPAAPGFRSTFFRPGVRIAVVGTVVAMLVLFVAVARRSAPPPTPVAATATQDVPLGKNGAQTKTPLTQPRTPPARFLRTAGVPAPLLPIEPLVLESMELERIEDAPALDLAALDVAGLTLDPLGALNMQENQ